MPVNSPEFTQLPELIETAEPDVLAQLSTPGSKLVLGCPGTGKTTLLKRLVASQYEDGTDFQQTIVLAQSRPKAQELRAAIIGQSGKSQLQAKVFTPHSWALEVLLSHQADGIAPKLLTNPQQVQMMVELLANSQTEWPSQLKAAITSTPFVLELQTFLARARQVGLDGANIAGLGEEYELPLWQAAGEFFEEYLQVLDAEEALDYAELIYRARLLVSDDQIANALARQIKMIVVDEFEDCDAGVVQLLALLAEVGVKVVAFADETQAVFGFRGADPASLKNFSKLFGNQFYPAETIHLEINYRSSKELFRFINQISKKLGSTLETTLGSASSSGEVAAIISETRSEQARTLAEKLAQLHHEQNYDWSQMAIINRTGGAELTTLAALLDRLGIPVQIEGDSRALAEQPGVKTLLSWLIATYNLAILEDGLDAEQPHLHLNDELLIELCNSPLIGAASDLFSMGRVRKLAREDEENVFVQQVDGVLAKVLKSIADENTVPEILWTLWTATNWPERLEKEALGKGDHSRQANRELDAICALFDLAESWSDLTGEPGLGSFLTQLTNESFSEDTRRESDLKKDAVMITTAHLAKGQQWLVVMVTGLEEGNWPNLRRPGSWFELDRLNPSGLPLTRREIMFEEMRLFNVACSRAVEQLFLWSVSVGTGEESAASRFISGLEQIQAAKLLVSETGLPVTPRELAFTSSELVGQLREANTNSELSPTLRSGAAALLAKLAAATDENGKALVRSADPSNWWSVRGLLELPETDLNSAESDHKNTAQAKVKLGPSEVEALLTCPRRWFLDRKGGANNAHLAGAEFGTLIHQIVDLVETENLSRQKALKIWQTEWSKIDFGSLWQNQATFDDGVQCLERFFEWRTEESRKLVATEAQFDLDIPLTTGNVRLRGSIDRIEEDSDGKLVLIDFKTGKTLPTIAEAETNDQLGCYQLAIQYGGLDERLGSDRQVGSAELIYLRVEKGARAKQLPKTFVQPALLEIPWANNDSTILPAEEPTEENWALEHLSRAAEIVRSGKYDATPQKMCRMCQFKLGCPALDEEADSDA